MRIPIAESFRLALCTSLILSATTAFADTLDDRLTELAADYRNDTRRVTVQFGIEAGERNWHVVSAADGQAKDSVKLVRGSGKDEQLRFVFDSVETLEKVAFGRLGALTAMGKAQESDPAPMDVTFAEAASTLADPAATFFMLANHFWTTGSPEVVPFGLERSRTVHGGQAVPLYYEQGIRSAWYGIRPGQHVNADKADQVNEFSSLLIVMRAGDVKARIGGSMVRLQDNSSILIPAGMAHEFWNDGTVIGEFVILMFGEKA